MGPGSVVLTSVLQSDGKIKSRPAVVLKEIAPFGDWLICPVSSQLRQFLPGVDLLIDELHPDYSNMRLVMPSIIRVCKLQATPAFMIKAEIGKISTATYDLLIKQLKDWL